MITFHALSLFVSLILPSSALALSQQQAFELLRDSGENLTVVGNICEQVSRLELMKEYPEDRYFITNGIAYGRDRATEGELDVIVFERPSMKVVLVGEVKCWSNFGGAKNKANKQRTRFLNVMSLNEPVNMWATKNGQKYQKSQFLPLPKFISISSKGAEAAGFDRALEMPLEELMNCQAKGSCRAADRR